MQISGFTSSSRSVSRRRPGTFHPRLPTILTAISTAMRLSPVTVTGVPSDTARTGPTRVATSVSIKELAEYLGHSDPAFTLRVYAPMLPCSHDRARAVISERFTRVMGPDS